MRATLRPHACFFCVRPPCLARTSATVIVIRLRHQNRSVVLDRAFQASTRSMPSRQMAWVSNGIPGSTAAMRRPARTPSHFTESFDSTRSLCLRSQDRLVQPEEYDVAVSVSQRRFDSIHRRRLLQRPRTLPESQSGMGPGHADFNAAIRLGPTCQCTIIVARPGSGSEVTRGADRFDGRFDWSRNMCRQNAALLRATCRMPDFVMGQGPSGMPQWPAS